MRFPSWVWVVILLGLLLFPYIVLAQESNARAPVRPDVSVVTPLPQEAVDGDSVVIVSPSSEDVTHVDVKHDGQTLTRLTADSRWVGEVDSQTLPEGEQELELDVCADERCETRTIPISVRRRPEQPSTLPDPSSSGSRNPATPSPNPPLHSLFPPALFSLTQIYDAPFQQIISRSTSEEIQLPPGTYSARLEFPDHFFSTLEVSSFTLSSDIQLASIEPFSLSAFSHRETPYEVVESYSLSLGPAFESASFSFPVREGFNAFLCTQFDSLLRQCSVTWQPISLHNRTFSAETRSSRNIIVLARKNIQSIFHDLTFSTFPHSFSLFSESTGRLGPFNTTASIPDGNYFVEASLENTPIQNIRFSRVSIDHSDTLLHFSTRPQDGNILLTYTIPYSFSHGSFSLAPPFNTAFDCGSDETCASPAPLPSAHFPSSSGTLLLAISPPRLDKNISNDNRLGETISWLHRLQTQRRFFESQDALARLSALNTLASSIEVSLECPSRDANRILPIPQDSFLSNEWETLRPAQPEFRQREDFLECQDVTLTHVFSSIGSPADYGNSTFLSHASAAKQTALVENNSSEPQTRVVGWRLIIPHPILRMDENTLRPSSAYQLLSPNVHTYSTLSPLPQLRFASSPSLPEIGIYDFSDLLSTGIDARVLVHSLNNQTVVDTLMEITLAPGESKLLDPTYILSSSANYTTRWAGNNTSGMAGTWYIGAPVDLNYALYSGVQFFNIDNGAYANDLFIPAAVQDVNGKADAGALYLIRNADSKYGSANLGVDSNYTIRWSGSVAGDKISSAAQPTPGYILGDVDGNGYNNDLLILSAVTSFGGIASGSVYLIKDIDKKSPGSYDLNNANFFDVRWDGNGAVSTLGTTNNSGEAVMLVDLDNNGFANDLILTVPRTDTQGLTNNGAVYIIRDIGSRSGILSLASSSSYTTAFHGGGENSFMGGSAAGGQGVMLVNIDGNAYANDLLITAPTSSVGTTTSGAVYLVRDVDKKTGNFPFATSSNYAVRWTGAVAGDFVGQVDDSNSALYLADLDGDSVTDDLLIACIYCDIVTRVDNGGVYLIKDINTLSGNRDLASDYDVLWFTLTNGDKLSATNGGGPGVQVVNIDGNTSSNDVVISCPYCDFQSRTDNGMVAIVNDAASRSGLQTLANASFFMVRFDGSQSNDYLGDNGHSRGAVQVRDVDGDGKTRDLLIGARFANTGKTDAGAIYWIRDVNTLSGVLDINTSSNYTARWSTNVENDRLSDSNRSFGGYSVLNLDNGFAANDMLITSPFADVNGKTDAGSVIIIRDFNSQSGIVDLSNSSNYRVQFSGAFTKNALGDSYYSGRGVQIVNADGNSYSNDLLISSSHTSEGVPSIGSVHLILDAGQKFGPSDLVHETNYFKRFLGGIAYDYLSATTLTGNGAQLVNTDNDAYPDLLLVAAPADINGIRDAGAVYRIEDVVRFLDVGVDYSFTLSLPSSGCVTNQGSTVGDGTCQRAWIETSATTDTQVEPEGQTAASSIPFFIYDNQSTTSSDFNIFLDLNASLPSSIVLKASNSGSGYAGSCNGNPSNNCVEIATTKKSLGKAFYSTGTNDLNIYFWADFTTAFGQTDRNVNSTAGQS